MRRPTMPKLHRAQGFIGVLAVAFGAGLVVGALAGMVAGSGAGLLVLGSFLLLAAASGA